MNILRSNLCEKLDLVLESINEADYISFDTEFTGLSDGEVRTHQYESLQDRYLKIKQNIEQYWICQLGIATFKYNIETDSYVSQIFNIYTYPSFRKLGITMSSMRFLVENQFDMNLLFKEAIPCERIFNENSKNCENHYGCYELSVKNTAILKEYEQKILEFLQTSEKNMKIELPNDYIKKIFFGSHGVIPKFKYLEIKADKQNPLLILFKKNAKKAVEYTGEKQITAKETTSEPTITPVIKAILSKKVPLIGHYMILDIAFFYDHFIGPLPNTLEEFRQGVFNTFPPLFDTKHLTKSLFSKVKFIKRTSVEDLYSYCKKRKELNTLVKIDQDPRFNNSTQAHEAGFDAFMTGYIFITLSKFLPNPLDINECAGKICLTGHYKDFIDVTRENAEDFNFGNVIKLVNNSGNANNDEIAKEMSKYADNFVIQENCNTFFVEFYEIGSEIEGIISDINSGERFRAGKFGEKII